MKILIDLGDIAGIKMAKGVRSKTAGNHNHSTATAAFDSRELTAIVHVTTRGGPFVDISSTVIRRRAAKMLHLLDLREVELSIALVDDATILELNRTYRGKNKPTDVLAFPLQEPKQAIQSGHPRGTRAKRPPPPLVGLLGDVILSIETARRQAQDHRRPLLSELTMLLAHGLLHLLGYDHKTDIEEREMEARTRELEAAAITRTRP